MTADSPATAGAAAPGRVRTPGVVAAGCVVALLAVAASVLVGAQAVSWSVVLDAGHPDHVLYVARVERTALALAVGAALGLAGACMQGLTGNPLADPGVLGINAGAGLAMVIGISAFGVSELRDYLWLAFLGAAVAAVAVHAIASMGRGGATPLKVVVAGAALTAAAASWTSGVLLIDRRTMESFRMWQVGTVGGRGIDVLVTGLPFLVVGAALALAGARTLNALALGDDLARGLGRRTGLDRVVLASAIVLLAGTATALAGPIAFVGLLAPHAVRAVAGGDHARVLPLSACFGGVLTVVADTVGRVVLPPAEVQVGIMMAAIGVPVFLVLVRRGRMGAL